MQARTSPERHRKRAPLTVIAVGLLTIYGAAATSYQAMTPGPVSFGADPGVATDIVAIGLPLFPPHSIVAAVAPNSAPIQAADLAAIDKVFHKVAFDLHAVRAAKMEVPRLFLKRLPDGFGRAMPVKARKDRFIRIVLPIILAINEEIANDRARIMEMQSNIAILEPNDGEWLMRLARTYKLDTPATSADFDALLARVDEVSVSVTLAQAIEESGWGRSRFATEGNALFGQRTWAAGMGLVPVGRGEGQRFEVRAFADLAESMRRYARNINTHAAYANYRAMRRDMRLANDPLNGNMLAGGLKGYSERGVDYVGALRNLIYTNNLQQLERASLSRAGQQA